MLSDSFWEAEFDVTTDDLDRIADRMRQEKRAFTLTELVRRVVRGRLEHGPDDSLAVLPEWITEAKVLSWNEVDKWQMGSRVLVARTINEEEVEPLLGIITDITVKDNYPTFHVHLEKLGVSKDYSWNEKNRPEDFYEKVKKAIWKMEQSLLQKDTMNYGDDEIDVIILKHGARITSRLLHALERDNQFVTCEERWFLKALLVDTPTAHLGALHRCMLVSGDAITLQDILHCVPELLQDDVSLFSLHTALRDDSHRRFECQGTRTQVVWRAVAPPPPPWQQAVGAYYVYDPQTYRILLQPGQRLKKEQAELLQSLGWYAEIVQPAE